MAWSYTATPDFSETDFSQWSKLLRDKVGIQLAQNQRQFLQSQVSMRMREVGEEDFTAYYDLVTDSKNGQLEWAILLDRLVVKETSFFRHRPSLDFACAHLQNKINNASLDDSFDVWSLGCSSGEEAYSLAILFNECFELAKVEPYFGISATDVSRVAVSLARTAVYSERKLEFIPQSFRYKYFESVGAGQYKFDHEVARKLCFTCANILNMGAMPKLKFDVIFCQNLLVYFDQELRHDLLDAIVERLKPGAILVIGLGEVINWNNTGVTRVAKAEVQAYVKNENGII